jgi:tRNA A-37 threonylcarbamoyl transferase component Bud32
MTKRDTLVAVGAGSFNWLVREDGVPGVSLLQDPDSYLGRPELLIKNSDIVTIGRVPPASATDRGLILRRLNYRNWRHRLRDLFRPSRAKMAMMRALALEAAGVPTPRALAVAEVRRFRWPVRAYLITEEVPDAFGIGWIIRRDKRVPGELPRKLALALAKLHEAGFSHRDLKPSNILVYNQDEVAFIDLDAVRQFKRLPDTRAMDDLVRLGRGLSGFPGISALHLARFLRHYCRSRGRDSQQWWALLKRQLTDEAD